MHNRRSILHAAVVIPDHVHLALSALFNGDVPFSIAAITQSIKGASAHRVNRMLGAEGSALAN
jgi:REP element-mobilizing transposase RayT